MGKPQYPFGVAVNAGEDIVLKVNSGFRNAGTAGGITPESGILEGGISRVKFIGTAVNEAVRLSMENGSRWVIFDEKMYPALT